MKIIPACEECRAIALEIAAARADAWDSADQRTKDAWDAVYRLIGGTEEDVDRAQRLSPYSSNAEPPRIPERLHRRISLAYEKKFRHEAETGHNVRPVSEYC